MLSIRLPAVITYSTSCHVFCPKSFFTLSRRPSNASCGPLTPHLTHFAQMQCSSSLSLSLPHTQTHTLTKTLHTGCPAYAPVAVKRGGPATNNPSRKKSSTHHSPVVLISGRNILKHRVRLFQISFYLN